MKQKHYETPRLKVNLQNIHTYQVDKQYLFSLIPKILTPKVVASLPAYFHDIDSAASAERWYEKMLTDSLLYVVTLASSLEVIGFVFVHQGDNKEAHIGYLLGEPYWGQGYANEMLSGFIDYAVKLKEWKILVAGVDVDNQASINLLNKLGFIEQSSLEKTAQQTKFYQYLLT